MEAIHLDPKNAIAFYNKACCYAVQNMTDLAIDNLQQAITLGYTDFKAIQNDPDLQSIRSDPRYKKLVGK